MLVLNVGNKTESATHATADVEHSSVRLNPDRDVDRLSSCFESACDAATEEGAEENVLLFMECVEPEPEPDPEPDPVEFVSERGRDATDDTGDAASGVTEPEAVEAAVDNDGDIVPFSGP